MTVSFEIPNVIAQRVLDAFAASYGHSATLPDGSANPQTKQQFLRAKIINFVRDTVVGYEASRDAETARRTATEKADRELVL